MTETLPTETRKHLLYETKSSHDSFLPSLVHVSSYSSGGEDGYTRIHYFDPHYFDFELEA